MPEHASLISRGYFPTRESRNSHPLGFAGVQFCPGHCFRVAIDHLEIYKIFFPEAHARLISHRVGDLDSKCVNTIRVLAADVVQQSQSGHPGAPMGCAPMAHCLWSKTMNYNPTNPKWFNRDRFVLSNGHACVLQYSMLHLTGYDLPMSELKRFRQIDSLTPGHPENYLTPGIEVSTGPLGQGICNAVGLAVAESHLAANFNEEGFNVIDSYTYVICGDGCLQEGVSSEASSLAGHLGLGKLIVLYDDNQITIDGSTDLSFTEDVLKRYESYGWSTSTVDDANDLTAMQAAIDAAKAVTDKPSIIKIKTIIGFGSQKQGTHGVHGAPLGAEDTISVKKAFGFNPEEHFVVPDDVKEFYGKAKADGAAKEAAWDAMMTKYKGKFPKKHAELVRRIAGKFPAGWKDAMPTYTTKDAANGTRAFSGQCLNAVADKFPELVGGSADLTPSNVTTLKKNGSDYQAATPAGRYMRFGVREHGMAAIANGMFAFGGVRPFVATFLNFITYAWGAVRLSALSNFGVLYIMTHDSIGLGEDGPTHQPVEVLELCRATPNMNLFRPADGNETAGTYIQAMEHTTTPSVMCYCRQKVPQLEGTSADKVAMGAYVLGGTNGKKPDIILAGSGSEVKFCVDVAKALTAEGKTVSVVSMPCWELFDKQSQAYKLEVFPDGVPVMSIEAMGTQGWQKYAHAPFGMERFGASAPLKDVMELFGFTVENLTKQAKVVLDFYKDKAAPSLMIRPDLSLTADHHH
ncbi:unnamed protein product [Chrysoparadoxa australica]